MAKTKTTFICQQCGNQAAKWMGKCSSCGTWDSFVEEILPQQKTSSFTNQNGFGNGKVVLLSDVQPMVENRIDTGDAELNRVLGGGIVKGSIVLIGGEPGIGKSTLLLQTAFKLKNKKILYVSGEESDVQIKMRAERISDLQANILISAETDTERLIAIAKAQQPDLLIIDSIQTTSSPQIEAAPGSISQVRQCAAEFMRFAKEYHIPIFLIGHITKDGSIAGPKILEHLVDTVLQFEGDRNHNYRILRTLKNRFGSASELGIYEMQGSGLREVANPSEILISQRDEIVSGMVIGTTLEGNRPLLVEVQALVSSAAYGTPQRSATGFDNKRLNMLLAVLEKRVGFRLSQHDVFLNIAGGLRIEDPAIDLPVCVAILSSLNDTEVNARYMFASEVGLGGELRPVARIESRIAEAEKLGFEKVIIAEQNLKGLDLKKYKIDVRPFSKIANALGFLFE